MINCIQCIHWSVADTSDRQVKHNKSMAVLGMRQCAKGEFGQYFPSQHKCENGKFEQLEQSKVDERIAFRNKVRSGK